MIINTNLSNTLNFLRWFAAFLVVIEHLRSLIFIDYINLVDKTLFNKFFYLITGFGHQAVIVFFVLSGFLVGGEFIRYEKNIINLKKYLIKRFSRIYIVFFPALVIGIILDYIGFKYFNNSLLYSNEFKLAAMNYNVSERLDLATFFGNIFMFQTSIVETLGSNGALWSLSNEWWYYMLLPLIYLILFNINIELKIISSVILILLVSYLNNSIFYYFFIWLMGMFIYKYPFNMRLKGGTLLSSIFVIVAFLISRLHVLGNGYISDILVGLSIIILINSLSQKENSTIYLKKLNLLLADFSYSLYLFHFPLLTVVTAILYEFHLYEYEQPTIMNFLLFLLMILLAYIFSFIMFILFENNTKQFKNMLINIFIKK